MQRVFALVVAAVFVLGGVPALFLYYLDSQWNGTDRRALGILAALAIYVFGVAAFAFWQALKPRARGSWILMGVSSPAFLYIGFAIVYSVVARIDEEVRDRRRMDAAAELWEQWPAPPDAHGIPAVVGERMLIATRHGVFESTDTARSWIRMADRFDDWGVERWQHVGASVFAVTAHKLFRSDDGGRSWVQLGVPYVRNDVVFWTDSAGPRAESMDVLMTDGDDLYLDTYSRVFRSEDLGESWTLAYQPDRTTRETRSLLVSGDTLWLGTFVGGLLRSVDRGASWTRLDGMPRPLVTSLAVGGDGLYAIGRADRSPSDDVVDVLRSTDGGDTWAVVGRGLPGRPIDLVGTVGTAMLVLSGRGVFSIERGETTWSEVPMPGPAVFAFPDGVGRFFGVSGGRLLQLHPDGKLYHFGKR